MSRSVVSLLIRYHVEQGRGRALCPNHRVSRSTVSLPPFTLSQSFLVQCPSSPPAVGPIPLFRPLDVSSRASGRRAPRLPVSRVGLARGSDSTGRASPLWPNTLFHVRSCLTRPYSIPSPTRTLALHRLPSSAIRIKAGCGLRRPPAVLPPVMLPPGGLPPAAHSLHRQQQRA